jgi:hypothetical protein
MNNEFIPKSLEILAQNGRFIELGKIDIWDGKYTRGLANMFESSLEQTLDLPLNLDFLSVDEQINLLLSALKRVGQLFGKTELKRLFRVYKDSIVPTIQNRKPNRLAREYYGIEGG